MDFEKRKNSAFSKNEKICWRYHHFTHVYQKSWSYAILFLRYGTDGLVNFHFRQFFALLPPNNPENENFKKMKKMPEDIII